MGTDFYDASFFPPQACSSSAGIISRWPFVPHALGTPAVPPRTHPSEDRGKCEAQMREAEMVGPGVSAISPSGGRVVADRYPTTLAAGEVAPEAIMSSATLGST
jgi:hypothetical protein